jgi:heme-degrading monooxygenase HmoA
VEKVAESRIEDFRALAGLQQKYYMQDAATGEYAGLYLWRSPEDFAAYRDSELRATIAQAYQTEGQPRVEVYRLIRPLREEA